MRYAFSRRELQFLNKNIFNNGLHGIPKPLTPFVTMKQRLINNNIISLNDNKELQIESVYKSLFDDWCKMDHIIEFKNEEYDLDIVLYNDTHIITIEENGFLCEIGYFLNEPVGLRNYILDKLNMPWQMRFDENSQFSIVLNSSDAQQLFAQDDAMLSKLSFKNHISKSVLKDLVIKTSTNKNTRSLYIKNLKDALSLDIVININELGHCLRQSSNVAGQVQYVVSVCDSKKFIELIMT